VSILKKSRQPYLEKIADYYIASNIHVGLSGMSFMAVSLYPKPLSESYIYLLFVFFSAIFSYYFIRIFENCQFNFQNFLQRITQQKKSILIGFLLTTIGAILMAIQIKWTKLFILLPGVFVTFWYAVPLFYINHKQTSLRHHPKLKLISIALVWAVVTVIFPLQDQLRVLNTWVLFFQVFFLVMALVLPFDIRDINKDKKHLQTLPQQLGIYNTKKIGILFLILFWGFVFLKDPISVSEILTESVLFIVTVAFLLRATPNQSKYYSSFWVESIPILWPLLLWVFR